MISGQDRAGAGPTAPRAGGALRLGLALAALAASVLMAAPEPAAAQESLEYPIKANYLVKFAAFVEWPPNTFASPASPVVVCVVGHDPFGPVLDRAAATGSPSGRPVVVRRAGPNDGRDDCHVAYVAGASARTQAEALAALAGRPVLTVTDSARPGPRGVIHFAISGNRVRFHIDDRAAQQRGLSISSRLLTLALFVRPRGNA